MAIRAISAIGVTVAAIDKLSVVIPVYNDEEVLAELYRRLQPVARELSASYEIVFVDDGSEDGSLTVLESIAQGDAAVVIVQQARNFGQHNAIAAGLREARGDIIVLMDSDLQDRPEDIPKLIAALQENSCNMAIARWITREDTFFKRMCFRLFSAVSACLTSLEHPAQLGVFRAITRSAVDAVKDIPETTGTMLSLLYWSGLSYVTVELHRGSRVAGRSGYDLKRMCALTADRIFSYSLYPVRAATVAGLLIGAASIVMGVYFVIRKFFMDEVVPGWTFLIAAALFLFGLNFVFIGMVGEYLGRIYLESKGRPRYITEKIFRQ
jgi:dolichol-phosphate mannosyltransferase